MSSNKPKQRDKVAMDKKTSPLIRWMRFVNAVLTPLVILGTVATIRQDLGKNLETGNLAVIIGQFIGGALWSSPFYLAWRELGPDSTVQMIQKARRTNIIVAGICLLLFLTLFIIESSSKSTSLLGALSFLLIMLIVAVPFALNIKALAHRKAELQEAKLGPAPKPIEAQAPPNVAVTISTTSVSTVPSTRQSFSNYFVRHWRGQLSLGISYWLNGILGNVTTIALVAAVGTMEEGGYSLRAISFATLGVLLSSVTVSVWLVVGILRSANHHVARGGSSGWANAARVGCVFSAIVLTSQLSTSILPQIKEYALIASGNDPLGEIDIKVSTNGQSIIIHGMLREGSAEKVQKILDAAPGATFLVLDSAGGRLLEAKQLASVIRSRALNTYVENMCASACTYVFLAGKDRAATPNAQIGFHQPSFPGLDADTQRSATQAMLEIYREAGLPESFIQRIGKTHNQEMWYPTRDELIAAHVITRVSLGGEAATAALGVRSKQELLLIWGSIPIYQAIEERFPGTIDKAVERGWAVKERGGSDADIQNAVRSTLSEILQELLKTADISTLESYLKLMISQMSTALAISTEACTKLRAATLDASNTLPREMVEREQQLLLHVLAKPAIPPLTPPDPTQLTQTMQKVNTSLPEKYLDVITNADAYTNQPDLACEAIIAYFRIIDSLPQRERHVALRWIFLGDDASPLTTHAQSKQKEARVRTKKEEIEEAVAAFAADPAHPYFNEVADEIIALIQDGMSLQEAYEKASARCTSQTVGTETVNKCP